MTRDPKDFEKPEMAYAFLDACQKAGIDIIFTCVARTYVEQTALFAQGREPLDYVNGLRRLAGLTRLTHDENKRKVTWTMNSKHIVNPDDERIDNDKSKALDFCILNKGRAVWDVKADIDKDQIPDYEECARIAESLGFKAGARFKNPDYPHIELKEAV